MLVIDLLLEAGGWVEYAYYDWGASLVLGVRSATTLEMISGQLIHIIFAGLLGIIFAYSLVLVSKQNYLFKGWVFGIFVWFAVHVIVNLFDFQPLRFIPVSQMIVDFVTASLYGIVLALTCFYLDKNEE